MRNVLTITINPSIDKTIWVNELIPEKKLRSQKSEVEPGGGGINVARAIHSLGGKTKALYYFGSHNGDYFNELMLKEGVQIEPIKIKDETRMNMMVIDKSNSHEYRIGMDGPKITSEEIGNLINKLKEEKQYEYWVLSGSLPSYVSVDLYVQIAQIAKENRAKLIVDTSGLALQTIVKQEVYLLKPNINELSFLCGKEKLEEHDIIDTGKEFLKNHFCKILAVSMGSKGAYIITSDEAFFQISPKLNVKSTVGAGDCMVAGMVLALSQQKSLKDVLKMGVACGSAATLNAGYGLCKKEDVEEILKNLI